MAVSLKTDLRFPESGQHGHGSRIIHSLFFNRVISIALSSILVVTSSLVVNLGDLMQKKLATISPIAWMRVADLDVNRFGVEISPSLSFIIWGYLILIGGLVGIICRRANNIDLIWEEYE